MNRNVNNQKNQGSNRNEHPRRNAAGFLTLLIWALILTLIGNYLLGQSAVMDSEELMFSEVVTLVKEDKVAEVRLENEKYTITLNEAGQQEWLAEFYGEKGEEVPEEAEAPSFYTAPLNYTDFLLLLDEHDVDFFTPYQHNSLLTDILVGYVLPMAVMLLVMMLFFRLISSKMGGGGIGGMGSVGKANAKVYVEKSTGVTFKDVAGQDEAKESLEEIIDFLHNPSKYTAIGAKLPKGALLVGSPGTGKTLLAKAVAGEANVPFFSISGSDFVEMFVGVGASRVRDLFKEASKMAPCIIFIDEIDTIGKSRDAGRLGGNDEREQTLNQLLAELDGFDPTKGVIVLGATNRPEVLDKALLRPGRFDRRITVDRPNLAGRLATLQVHTRKIRLADDVDLRKIAQATAGCVGADLANLVNEAALRAVRLGRKAVNQNDLLVSFELVIAGAEKKGTVLTEKEKRLIAYHEVGHALVAARQKGTEPVSKITIVPHTQGALGYTMQLPEEEKFLMDREELCNEIRTLLGGRSAEEVVFNTATTGASNDIERATDLARKMITMYGMSDKFGIMGLATIQSQYLDQGYGLTCAQATAADVDKEIYKVLEQCHAEAVAILKENREMLDKIASYLLKKETITGQEMMAILEGRDPETVDNYGAGSSGASSAQPSCLNSAYNTTALPSTSADGIEKPARKISMVSQAPVSPLPPDMEEPSQPEVSQSDDQQDASTDEKPQ